MTTNPNALRFQMEEEKAYADNWTRLARQARQVFDEDYAALCDTMAQQAATRARELKAQLDVHTDAAIDAHTQPLDAPNTAAGLG